MSLANAVRVAVAGGFVVVLAACGDDSPRPPIVQITPEPVRGVIAETRIPDFQPDVYMSIELGLSQRGVLDINVDWVYSDTWMYVYFGKTKCDYAQLSSHTCPFLISSETKDPKPRFLVTQSLEPATYYLVLYNVPRNAQQGVGSNNVETAALTLGLTVSADGRQAPDAVRLARPQPVSPPRL
jgi:hypothetical protein